MATDWAVEIVAAKSAHQQKKGAVKPHPSNSEPRFRASEDLLSVSVF